MLRRCSKALASQRTGMRKPLKLFEMIPPSRKASCLASQLPPPSDHHTAASPFSASTGPYRLELRMSRFSAFPDVRSHFSPFFSSGSKLSAGVHYPSLRLEAKPAVCVQRWSTGKLFSYLIPEHTSISTKQKCSHTHIYGTR